MIRNSIRNLRICLDFGQKRMRSTIWPRGVDPSVWLGRIECLSEIR